MNWTAWNSVRANALANRPSAMPRIAFPIASATTTHADRASSRSSSAIATADTNVAWTAATNAKAAP
jgi:hypothetical protein